MSNRTIFRVIIIVFTLLMAVLAFQMAMNTTAPWNKHKNADKTAIKP